MDEERSISLSKEGIERIVREIQNSETVKASQTNVNNAQTTQPAQPSQQPVQPAQEYVQTNQQTESSNVSNVKVEEPKEESADLGSGAIEDDEELLKFIQETEQKIYVIGAGGSGSNTLDRLFEMGVKDATLIAMNTDARHLLKTRANKKILLGKRISRGRGAGSNPAIGEEAAKEALEDIKKSIQDASMIFITCGLGGGTGTGSAPVIAEIAKKMGILTVAVVTLPFTSEGRTRMENALSGLEKLRKNVDTLIVIKNDKLLSLVPDLPLNTAFKVCDEVLAGSVKGIVELVTKSGLVNVDFADLKTILSDAGYAVIGLGEASLEVKNDERAKVAIETALNSPLLDADISSARKALINVIGGTDMTLREAEYVVAETSKRINPDSHIIWGARIEENLKKSSIRVLIVLAGVKFKSREEEKTKVEIDELDLDIIG